MPIKTSDLAHFPFDTVLAWYTKHGRQNLPWREYGYEPQTLLYRVWTAEIMLQQTQASRVVDYYTRFLERFPTIQSLSEASWEDFFPYYEGLGYYRRGRNMLALAQEVMSRHDGIFPCTIEDLEKLPGVGPYTARAICAFALDEPVLSFDTNLSKIFSRYYFGNKNKKLTKDRQQLIQDQFEKTGISGRDINNALMDFGAIVSIRNPLKIDWESYPLEGCKFGQEKGIQEVTELSVQTKKTTPKHDLSIIVDLHQDHKIYFSEDPDIYVPFVLPRHRGDHRHFIKKWFEERHDLTLSVRPPYERDESQIRYHAQVQRGDTGRFGAFPSKDAN